MSGKYHLARPSQVLMMHSGEAEYLMYWLKTRQLLLVRSHLAHMLEADGSVAEDLDKALKDEAFSASSLLVQLRQRGKAPDSEEAVLLHEYERSLKRTTMELRANNEALLGLHWKASPQFFFSEEYLPALRNSCGTWGMHVWHVSLLRTGLVHAPIVIFRFAHNFNEFPSICVKFRSDNYWRFFNPGMAIFFR